MRAIRIVRRSPARRSHKRTRRPEMLEVARGAGHVPFGTFDKALARREGTALLA